MPERSRTEGASKAFLRFIKTHICPLLLFLFSRLPHQCAKRTGKAGKHLQNQSPAGFSRTSYELSMSFLCAFYALSMRFLFFKPVESPSPVPESAGAQHSCRSPGTAFSGSGHSRPSSAGEASEPFPYPGSDVSVLPAADPESLPGAETHPSGGKSPTEAL